MSGSRKLTVCTVLSIVLTALVSGCGGGGGGGTSSAANLSTPTVTTDLTTQNAAAALTSGYYSLSWSVPAAGVAPVSGTNYLYSVHIITPASPASGTQTYNLTESNLATTLALPDISQTGISRVVKDGKVYARSSQDKISVYFSGNDVVFDDLASDGSTVISSGLFDSWSAPIALSSSDPIQIAPDELKAAVGFLTRTTDSNFDFSPRWQAGSAYYKVSSVRRIDTLYTYDWSGKTYDSNINGSNFSGTLEQFFASITNNTLTIGSQQFTIGDGTISSVSGVRAWVANTAVPASTLPTTGYYTLYEMNGSIYIGYLERANTRIHQISSLDGTVLLDYSVRLNDAAINSIKQALKF